MAMRGTRKMGGEPKEFQEEVLQIDRVTRVVKGGRRLRFRATVIVGNLKGLVGMGIGKSNEIASAIQKGISKAKKNLLEIPIYKGTIPHDVKAKFKSSKVILRPACEGTGLIAGSSLRKIVELGGVKNIIAKSLGSPNRINNARATMKGIMMLKRFPKKTSDQK